MKKIILAVSLLAFAGSQVQPAKAGCAGPAIAAGVLGGLTVGTIVGASIAQQPTYYAPAPVYYYPPQTTYYPTAPAVTYSTPAPTATVPAPATVPSPAVVPPAATYPAAPPTV